MMDGQQGGAGRTGEPMLAFIPHVHVPTEID
jgi:hypothetical protein